MKIESCVQKKLSIDTLNGFRYMITRVKWLTITGHNFCLLAILHNEQHAGELREQNRTNVMWTNAISKYEVMSSNVFLSSEQVHG